MSNGLNNLSPESKILLILKVVTGLSRWKDDRTGLSIFQRATWGGGVEELEATLPIQGESE